MKAVLALCLLLLPAPAHAERVPDLYRAWAFVTGQRAETRDPALLQGFKDVLVKISGDPSLLNDPKAEQMFDASAVDTYSYRDLMADIPKHDEQGTRDRPFEITMDFVPRKIDAALAQLGRKPWGEERPKLVALIGVEIGKARFVIPDEGEPGALQRKALLFTARRYGIPLVLPTRAALEKGGVTVDSLKQADPAALETRAAGFGGERVLAGSMVFSDALLGWIADWEMAADTKPARWHIEGVNFDEAFRNAIRGSAQILSGHGVP